MCGIAGMMGTERGCVADGAVVRRMCDVITHRGPDDYGAYINGPVGLGMRRLSIIDLSTGHQPIANEDETIWIVYNGEVYNFIELRDELRARGHVFRTNTDTEAIVHLYEEFGSDCVKRLRGMFAFAIYDSRNRSLLLARDRLGKKPLHYAIDGDWLVFGSEIKSLLEAAPGLAEVNREGILNYFYFGYIPDPQSAFRKIHKLPPGHLLEFRNGRLEVKEYWDVPAYGTHGPISEEECLEELERRLSEAVRLRLISDVPLGAMLSGGVDSSIVVGLMARATSRPVKTFTIGFDHNEFDETHYARQVANAFATEHHELILNPDVVGTLEKLTPGLEEPFADSSILPTYYVSKLAREHVTVALSGDGGDELFAGYERYTRLLRRSQLDHLPQWLGRLYREQIFHRTPSFYGRRFLFNISLPLRDRYIDSVSHFPAWGRERELFSKDFLAWSDSVESPLNLFRRYFDEAPAKDFVSRLLYLDTKTYLPFDILTKVDRMSMATSLEVRVPMLDHVFLEWVTSLPGSLKLRGMNGKYILKKLAERVGVPSEVLHRPKRGFAMPLVHWMRQELKRDLAEILLEPRTLERGYYSKTALRKLVEEHTTGRRDRSHELWLLLMLELWHRNFLEARAGRRLQSTTISVLSATDMQTVSSSSSRLPEGAEFKDSARHFAGSSDHRRRVFFLLDSLQIGGTETQAVELALRLDPAHYAVTLGCLQLVGPLLAKLEGSSVSVMEWKTRGGVNSPAGIYQILRLARFLRHNRFEVAHLHDLWSNLLGIPAAWLARVPVIISSRRDLAHLAWYTPRRRKILRHLQSLSTAVLVNSGQIREQLVHEDGFPPASIRVVYNGIDLDRFKDVRGARERLFPGLQDCKLVVSVANMHSDIKGQPTLIKAASEVCAKFPQARFVLIGDGTRRVAFETMAVELGLKNNVLFLGQRHDVADLLACCDIAVLPSQAEGFPNALLEYMTAGLPAIATDVGGNREVIEHRVNGLLTATNDPHSMAREILYLLENPTAASDMANAGRERVRKDFSFDKLVANTGALYTDLLQVRR